MDPPAYAPAPPGGQTALSLTSLLSGKGESKTDFEEDFFAAPGGGNTASLLQNEGGGATGAHLTYAPPAAGPGHEASSPADPYDSPTPRAKPRAQPRSNRETDAAHETAEEEMAQDGGESNWLDETSLQQTPEIVRDPGTALRALTN